MAARNISTWVPITWDAQVVGIAEQPSAVVAASRRRRPMTTTRHDIPRFLDADVGGGSALTEDTNDGSVASLYAYQFTGKFTFDEMQSDASPADEQEAALYTWANNVNIAYDNAALGVTAARSATATDKRPYNSVYYTVRNADSDAGYSADANYNAASSFTYAELNTTLGLVETSKFWNPMNGAVIIHPSLMEDVRNIKTDTTNMPIFVESSNGSPGGGVNPQYNLFGYPAFFSHGALTSANFSHGLGGVGADGAGGTRRPLVIFVNREHLVYGPWVEPQARLIPAAINPTALEDTVQTVARRGFVLTVPQAAAVLEFTG